MPERGRRRYHTCCAGWVDRDPVRGHARGKVGFARGVGRGHACTLIGLHGAEDFFLFGPHDLTQALLNKGHGVAAVLVPGEPGAVFQLRVKGRPLGL